MREVSERRLRGEGGLPGTLEEDHATTASLSEKYQLYRVGEERGERRGEERKCSKFRKVESTANLTSPSKGLARLTTSRVDADTEMARPTDQYRRERGRPRLDTKLAQSTYFLSSPLPILH